MKIWKLRGHGTGSDVHVELQVQESLLGGGGELERMAGCRFKTHILDLIRRVSFCPSVKLLLFPKDARYGKEKGNFHRVTGKPEQKTR